ncbi:MAG TPA: peptidylprolyl isomerase [Cyclobacteriaceae bacterium]|nr:peptidylprolyl isomerase [Cyclobacteriaceae bacterium]
MRRSCIIALIVCAACADKEASQSTTSRNHFADDNFRKIADLQDRRKTDSLVSFLYSDKDEYRRAAALAFGSVQDTSAIDTLGRVATPDLETRLNVAFALGQMYKPTSMKWLQYGELGDEPEVQHEIMEAMGKVITKDELSAFPSDGDAWGVYRAGLRGVLDGITTNLALSKLDSSLGAAHFFARSAFKSTPEVEKGLIAAATNADPEIRMAVVSALAKIDPPAALPAVTKAAEDTDYRVRVSAARALRTQPWEKAKPVFEKLLNDENAHVNVAAAEVIINLTGAVPVESWASSAKNWRTQATLYEWLLKKSPSPVEEVKALYSQSKNPYQKAALLNALSQTDNADFIFQEFQSAKEKVIKSTAASAIVRINRRTPKESSKFVEIYKHIIIDGDQGAIIPVCDAFQDSTLGFKKLITDVFFLETAKSKLSLPRDYETYVPLDQALSYLKGLPEPEPLKNEFNHPIDWKLAATIDRDQKVVIETSKGKIIMQLFIEEAPGSVVNFVKLVNDKYFDGKFFHRVVPNFVIQTGCSRGDGFGSEDYSIRSEFSRRKYKTGSVGMASAGKDTEGTQWFITHSPTPHLDGKYTIFAEVIEGMDVVHKIEVGDQIVSARLVNGK